MPDAAELERSALDHIWFHATSSASLKAPGGMIVFESGDGCYLTDVNGRTYLDGLSGGAFVTNVGHGRGEIADAMAAQARKLAYVTPYNFAAEPTIRLAEKIASLAPGDLNRVFFTSGGSEAVETALKIARQYHFLNGDRKRYKVISRHGSYHGSTYQTMSISGASHDFNSRMFAPLAPGSVQVPWHNCYRCELETVYPACRVQCARTIEKAILHEGPDTIAAIIAEPIPAAATIHVPVDEYLPMLRDIADKYGILLIIDEVINGFGRTGRMFANQYSGIVPDIMTVAKGLTSGYAPMGAAIASDRVVAAFDSAEGRDAGLNNVLSFGGHATAAAAALKNIEIMEREALVENSAAMGAYLLDGLNELRKLPIVGDVRGRGLLAAVELVRDKHTREPFAPADMMSARITARMRDEGVLMRTFQVAEFGPPLNATRTEIDHIVGAMERTILWYAGEMGLA